MTRFRGLVEVLRWHTDAVTEETAPARALDAPPRRRRPRAVTLVGLGVLVLALAALGWSVYDLVLRPPLAPDVASRQIAELRQEWQAGDDAAPDPLAAGRPVAILTVPALGGAEWPVLAGADAAVLRDGLGWYPGTAAPGDLGNFAVAGQGGLNGPFAGLARLTAGDEIVVETATRRVTYRVNDNPPVASVQASDTWVIQPVPGRPEVKPTQALITLTTAADLVGSASRTAAFGTMISATEKG